MQLYPDRGRPLHSPKATREAPREDAAGILASIARMLGAERPPVKLAAQDQPTARSAEASAEDRRKRESLETALASVREENKSLKRRLAESKARASALETALLAHAEATVVKPESVADADHRAVTEFIRIHGMDANAENYDRVTMGLAAKGKLEGAARKETR